MKNNKDIKPFYIYADKNALYIKNINEQTEKLANNIYSYSANIDDNKNIHICGLDTKGKLTHFFNNNGHWKKRGVHKILNNIKNVKYMRLYLINNFLNVFIIEKYPISENLYKVSHFNFNYSDYKIYKYTINNICKENEHIYKLNIDELSNIVFEYKKSNTINRNLSENIIIFNSASRKWINPSSLSRGSKIDLAEVDAHSSNIKDDIFEYCYSIKYKI
ncbi:MAG: hypothetical protein ACRC3Y_02845 [Romboutsia sp.]|uniref:hypothetical protein n=1 Tax=Romboutsia sp. TaxID=1965302 RepID=UPI003F401CAC